MNFFFNSRDLTNDIRRVFDNLTTKNVGNTIVSLFVSLMNSKLAKFWVALIFANILVFVVLLSTQRLIYRKFDSKVIFVTWQVFT